MEKHAVPKWQVLEESDITHIVERAYALLSNPGVTVRDKNALELMSDAGAKVDVKKNTVRISPDLIDDALKSVPKGFDVYDHSRKECYSLRDSNVYFETGGTPVYVHDFHVPTKQRFAVTQDLIHHIKVVNACNNISFHSSLFTTTDVPPQITDAYRLFVSLLFSTRPTILTAFTPSGYKVMRKLLWIVARGAERFSNKPSHIICANSVSPLGWSQMSTYNLINSARDNIPSMAVHIPFAGATAPVTLAGTMLEATAENLSGLVIHQAARSGARFIWGGGACNLNMRSATPTMASPEAILLDCGIIEIGKHFRLPTTSNLGRADGKRIDMQAGIESGLGITASLLAGANIVAGPGMLEFASTQSLEKLIIDNEICGFARRLSKGINVCPESLAEELIRTNKKENKHFLTSKHTLRFFKEEFWEPSFNTIDQDGRSGKEADASDIRERAHLKVKNILDLDPTKESSLEPACVDELFEVMEAFARKEGMDKLPISREEVIEKEV
jgi:trimethylamine--corrinoid protein Co-methyltransferase